ncbi:hypothetical protein AAHE18_18G086500 [Arachis hypogaea]
MAADSMNGYCLSCYMVSMIIILLLEGAVTADILLNSDWEKDLPEDPTGKFSDFKDFVESNFDVCKWIMLVIISAQLMVLILTMTVIMITILGQGFPSLTIMLSHHFLFLMTL